VGSLDRIPYRIDDFHLTTSVVIAVFNDEILIGVITMDRRGKQPVTTAILCIRRGHRVDPVPNGAQNPSSFVIAGVTYSFHGCALSTGYRHSSSGSVMGKSCFRS